MWDPKEKNREKVRAPYSTTHGKNGFHPTSKRRHIMTVDESIFVLSFNTNSAELSDEALQGCLKDAKGATMIICSFQEYDVPPRRCLPAPPAVYTGLGEEEEEQVEVEETKSRRKIKGNLQQQKYLRLWSSRKKAAEAGFAYTNTFDEGDVMRLSKLQKAIEALDDDEDVQNIFTNLNFI